MIRTSMDIRKSRVTALFLGLFAATTSADILVYEQDFDGFANLGEITDWSIQGFDPEGWTLNNGALFNVLSDKESDPVAFIYNGTPEINALRRYRVVADMRLENSWNGTAGHASLVVGHVPGVEAVAFTIAATRFAPSFYDYNNIGFTRDGTANLTVTDLPSLGLQFQLNTWYHMELEVDLYAGTLSFVVTDENSNTVSATLDDSSTPTFDSIGIDKPGQFGVLGFTRSQLRVDNFQIFAVPPPNGVPAASSWGLGILSVFMAVCGTLRLRNGYKEGLFRVVI